MFDLPVSMLRSSTQSEAANANIEVNPKGCENLPYFSKHFLGVRFGERSYRVVLLNALKKPSQSVKLSPKRVRRIPPSEAIARDEGPRLIPLLVKTRDQLLASTGNYYLALADKLLHRRRHR